MQRHDRGDLRVLARQRAVAIEIPGNIRSGERAIELLEPRGELCQFGGKRRFHTAALPGLTSFPRRRESSMPSLREAWIPAFAGDPRLRGSGSPPPRG